MENKMEFNQLYRQAKFGLRVLEAFYEVGVKTAYRAHVLLELHNAAEKGIEISRSNLRKAIGNPDNALFTSNILKPLKLDGYIELYRGPMNSKVVSITSTGEGLVDDVMRIIENQ